MALVERAFYQSYFAVEEFRKLPFHEMFKEKDANYLYVLANNIGPIHWLSLMSTIRQEQHEKKNQLLLQALETQTKSLQKLAKNTNEAQLKKELLETGRNQRREKSPRTEQT